MAAMKPCDNTAPHADHHWSIPQSIIVDSEEPLPPGGYTTDDPRIRVVPAKHFVCNGVEPYEYIDIVCDGPPEAEAGRFVEVEAPDGSSIRAGEWIKRDDDYWVLRIPGSMLHVDSTPAETLTETVNRLLFKYDHVESYGVREFAAQLEAAGYRYVGH